MRDYDEVVRLVYGGDDIRHGGSGKVHDFRTALSASIYLRNVAQQYRDFALPRLFALEAEGWRRAEHPTEEMSAELLQEESFEDFLFAPCSTDIQSYFQVLSVGDWEQLLREYLEDNTQVILKTYHELFDD